MNAPPPSHPRHGPRLVICDVDGVVFQGQFLLSLARGVSWSAWLASLRDCLLYEWGRIPLEELLRRVYRRARGMPEHAFWRAYERLPLAAHVRETVRSLRQDGHEVWLVSAGVPQEMILDLVERTGADGGAGLQASFEGGQLTGRVSGQLSVTAGKVAFVEEILAERDASWSSVVAIGDDRNNVELLKAAGVSIGFCATYAVRRTARFLVDSRDFAEVAAFVNRAPGPPGPIRRRPGSSPSPVRGWRQELRRKSIHAAAVLTLLAHRRFPMSLSIALLSLSLLYLASEFFRLNGSAFPLFHRIMRRTMRRGERRRLALAPVTLAAGVLASLYLFPPRVAYAAILIVAISDSVASVVGSRWGRHPLPHNRYKSLEGTSVALIAAVCCAWVYLPLRIGLAAALAAAATESLDIGDWDNLLAPVAAGAMATVLSAL